LLHFRRSLTLWSYVANWLIGTFPFRSTKYFIMSNSLCGARQQPATTRPVAHSPVVLNLRHGRDSCHSSSKRCSHG
jgi:hypothetical protein